MRAPDPAGLSHRMSTMQDTTSPNRASVVLPLDGNYNPRAQLANWRSLVWSAVLPNVDMGRCLARQSSFTRGRRNPHFRQKSQSTSRIISPVLYQHRRDGRSYNATGGSGSQSAATVSPDWTQHTIACFSQHAVTKWSRPQLYNF